MIRVADIGDFRQPRLMEGRGRDDQDRGVNEKSQRQRNRGIPGGEADGLAFPPVRGFILAGLHDRRMQVQVMRHDRGPENPDGDIQLCVVRHQVRRRDQSSQYALGVRFGQPKVDREANSDGRHKDDHELFDGPKTPMLQKQNEQYVERRDQHAVQHGNAEQQLQGDGGADDFGQVAGSNGKLAKYPKDYRNRFAVLASASLRQILSRHDAKFA